MHETCLIMIIHDPDPYHVFTISFILHMCFLSQVFRCSLGSGPYHPQHALYVSLSCVYHFQVLGTHFYSAFFYPYHVFTIFRYSGLIRPLPPPPSTYRPPQTPVATRGLSSHGPLGCLLCPISVLVVAPGTLANANPARIVNVSMDFCNNI